jgi:PAS domain S-box-containing protein
MPIASPPQPTGAAIDAAVRPRPLILIVDDLAFNRDYLISLLNESYRLHEVASGEEALRFIHEVECPDLVLLDLLMPGMGGDEVLQRIRSEPLTFRLPVIIFTADDQHENEQQCLKLGADDFLQRPFSVDILRLRIGNLIRRHQVEQDLASSRAWAQRIFLAAPVPFLVVDEHGIIQQINQRAEQIFGYTTADLTGQEVEILLPERLRQGHIRERLTFMRDPRIRAMGSSHELLGRRRSGEEFPMHVSLSPTWLNHRIYIIVGIDDLSERRGYEAQLRERGDKYLHLFMSMSQGVVYHDRQGRVVDANPAATAILGLSMDQLLGRDSLDPRWHCVRDNGSDFPGYDHPAMVALRTGRRISNVLMGIYRPDEPRPRWILINATPIFHPGEREPVQVHVIFSDITPRRESELALRQSERFADTIIESSGSVMIVIDRRGSMIRLNAAVERLTGLRRPDLLGYPFWQQLIPTDQRDSVRKAIDKGFEQRQTGEYEHDLLTHTGTRIPFHWYYNLASDEEGRPIHLIAQGHDLRPLFAARSDLQESNDQFLSLFESSPDPAWLFEEYCCIDCNRAAINLLAVKDKTHIIGHHAADFSPPDQADGRSSLLCAEEWLDTARQQQLERIEWQIRRSDGEIRHTEANLAPIHLHGRTLIYVVLRDVTATRANERIIQRDREQQELLRTVLEEGFVDAPLSVILERCLRHLLDLSWFQIMPKGGVFISQPDGELQLSVAVNLDSEIRTRCAQIMPGNCHCGQAAARREIIYSARVDKHHTTQYSRMADHGHYNVPLLAGNELVGVLVLYLAVDTPRDSAIEAFLLSVSKILAGIIRRKRDETQLRDREALYRRIVETSTDGFVMTNREGFILESNRAFSLLSGYPADRLATMHLADLTEDRDRRQMDAILRQTALQGAESFELNQRTANGRQWPAEISISWLAESEGRYFAFYRDITQREEMRNQLLRHRAHLEEQVSRRTAELEQNRQRLASIIDNLPAILYIKDSEGRYQLVNQYLLDTLNLQREEMMDASDSELFPPEIAGQLQQHDRAVMNELRPLTVEEQIPFASGRNHNLLATRIPLFNSDGSQQGLLGIAIDITPLKDLQQQLSQAQEMAHLGSWRLDIATSELTWSEETYRIFLLPPATPVHLQDFFNAIHPDDRQGVINAWEASLRGHPYDVEHRIQSAGQIRWLREQGEIINNTEGKAVLAIGTVQDITDIKLTQAALESALSEAHRMARIKSEFLANMSHEIRTPLNAILGLAQIGMRNAEDSHDLTHFGQIYESGELLLGIVNDILDFSRIEAGKLRIEEVEVQLERLIRHVTLMCSERASAKGFALRIEVVPTVPPWFRGDPLRIAQILNNLVGNAIKFTEQGEVTLTIAVDGDKLLFTVQDSGIGMSAEFVSRLFTPFEQADGSITRRFGGTGLGLAITHRLVTLMMGSIHVHSTLGVGSRFEVRLPLHPINAPHKPLISAGDKPQPPPLGGLRILVAEDNIVNRMVLEDMLSREGVEITCAENGQQAIEIFRQRGTDYWDIVLTDIHMPVMGGYELTQQILALAPQLAIVGVTAHAMQEERQRCLDAGMVAHVAKPIVLADLLDAISRFARQRPSTPSLANNKDVVQPIPATAAPPQETTATTPAAPSTIESHPATTLDSSPLSEWIDLDALNNQFKGRQSFINRMFATLLQSHSSTAQRLRSAADSGDLEAVAFTAHSFAGAVGALYATPLRMAAKEVEAMARENDPAVVTAAHTLASKAETLLAVIQSHLEQFKDPS